MARKLQNNYPHLKEKLSKMQLEKFKNIGNHELKETKMNLFFQILILLLTLIMI